MKNKNFMTFRLALLAVNCYDSYGIIMFTQEGFSSYETKTYS